MKNSPPVGGRLTLTFKGWRPFVPRASARHISNPATSVPGQEVIIGQKCRRFLLPRASPSRARIPDSVKRDNIGPRGTGVGCPAKLRLTGSRGYTCSRCLGLHL
ncbi:hypothetical protein J6590_023123 [Homalodisca vitripennis]|nr:hypothetical protein J6590_023123 [Homalodisca vitripennis]